MKSPKHTEKAAGFFDMQVNGYNLVVAGLFAVLLALGYVDFQMTHSNRAAPSKDGPTAGTTD